MPDQKDKKTKNNIKQAAALRYDATKDDVPRIVGLGVGEVAEKIIAKAEEHDVPIVEDAALAETLQHLGIGDDIPEELYQVIAEVMVFIARLDGDRGRRFGI